MQTVSHGGTGAPVFTAANVLADMSASLDSSRANELIADGILDTITTALTAEYEPSEDSKKYKGKTLFQLLRVLQNLSDFTPAADAILAHDDRKLVRLLIKSGYSIELGAGDSWVQPLSDIFASLLKSELAINSPSSEETSLLDTPLFCNMLSTRILPYYDPYTSTLGEQVINSLSYYFANLPGHPSEKFLLLNSIENANVDLIPDNHHHRSGNRGNVSQTSFFDDVVDISLLVTKAYWTSPYSSKRTESTTKALTSTLHAVASLLSEKEASLLTQLEADLLSRQPAPLLPNEDPPRDPIFYVMDNKPWHSMTPRDDASSHILKQRQKVLDSFHTLVSALPPSPSDARSVNELLKTLLLATNSLDEDVMFTISRHGTWLQDVLHTWLLVEPSTNAGTPRIPVSQASEGHAASVADDLENWEVCPVRRPTIEGASQHLANSIRRRTVRLLARLSTIPTVASKISITRCLCGIQLEHGPSLDYSARIAETPDFETSTDSEDHEDELNAAKRTVAQLRPLQTIVHNVARYAPEHFNAIHLQRLVTMNPSEMESLILLSNITNEKPIADIILSDHMLSHLIFSRLQTASRLAPYQQVEPKRGQKPVLSIEPLPIADDEYVHFITRLSLQAVSNLAKTNPQVTLSKLNSTKAISFLQRCITSTDETFKALAVLTFARLSSAISAQDEAQRKPGKRILPTVDSKLFDGVDILYPTSKVRSDASTIAPPDYEVISDENFDIVFIHGINGHPITTWRVENPSDAAENRVLLWPKATAKKTKEHVERTYRAYMKSLNDPDRAFKEAEAEQAVCWPRDWMPLYLPGSRILTVSYDIALTKWSASETMPLKRRAAEILTKLRLLGVGEKPVIFVAHSFGGLIVKEMLQECSKLEEYRDMLTNTRAILFFSTPHRGSILAGYATGATDLLFRGSTAVIELYPTNWYLHHLNDIFPKVAAHIPTLSIGETETCFLESLGSSLSTIGAEKYTCYQIVPDESSNPSWGGPAHEFIKLPYNHRQVCKPESSTDDRFQLVLDFFKRYSPKSKVAPQDSGTSSTASL